MDERCQQFHADAQKPLGPHTQKEIERLKKFLFKNQEYRFSEREQSWLFSAVQAHYSSYQSSHDEDNPALGLLEDALKMPFTVFTTSQKKTMLKWHAKLTGHAADGGAAAHADAGGAHAAHAAAGEQCSVIDVAQGAIQVMNDDGDTYDIPRSVCAGELAQRIADAFERGDDVRVRVVAGSGGGRDKLIAAVL